MGTQLTKEYDIDSNPFGNCGPRDMWSMYHARRKQTGEAVTIITCRKRELATKIKNNTTITHAMQLLERSGLMLSKLSLPGVVRLMEGPLLHGNKEVAIVVEPVRGTLKELSRMDAQGVGGSTGGITRAVEMRVGLADLLSTITSLHDTQHWAHLNINPNSIFITADRKWKLGGFEFAHSLAPGIGLNDSPGYKSPQYAVKKFNGPYLYPDLDYAAPEYVLRGRITAQADVWSFGVMAHWLLLNQPLVSCHGKLEAYRSCLGDNVPSPSVEGPPIITSFLKHLIERDSSQRPKTRDLMDVELLHRDRRVVAVRGLDGLSSMDTRQRIDILRTVEEEAHKLPPELISMRVVPALQRYVRDAQMMPHVLPPLLTIGELMNNEEFVDKILPWVSKGMRRMEPPKLPKVILKYLQPVIIAKLSSNDVHRHVPPFLSRCITSSRQDIQIQALEAVQECMKSQKYRLSYADFRKELLPHILRNAQHSQTDVRIAALTTLGIVASLLDRTDVTATINQGLIPALTPSPDNDHDGGLNPEIVMTAVGVFNTIAKNANRAFIARTILPAIVPLTAEDSLSMKQFSLVMKAIRGMLTQIETDRNVDHQEHQHQQLRSNNSKPKPKPAPPSSSSQNKYNNARKPASTKPAPGGRPHQPNTSAPIPPRPRKTAPHPPVAPKKPPPVSQTGNLLFDDENDKFGSSSSTTSSRQSKDTLEMFDDDDMFTARGTRTKRSSSSSSSSSAAFSNNATNQPRASHRSEPAPSPEQVSASPSIPPTSSEETPVNATTHGAVDDTADEQRDDRLVQKDVVPSSSSSWEHGEEETNDQPADDNEVEEEQQKQENVEQQQQQEKQQEEDQEDDNQPKLDPRLEAILSGNFSWDQHSNKNDNDDNDVGNTVDTIDQQEDEDHTMGGSWHSRERASSGTSSNTDFDSLMSRFLSSKESSNQQTVSWPTSSVSTDTNIDTYSGTKNDENDTVQESDVSWQHRDNFIDQQQQDDSLKSVSKDYEEDDPWTRSTTWKSSSGEQRNSSTKDIDFDKALGLFLNSRNSSS